MSLHIIDGLRIRTDCICPPIPVRDFDWCAVLDDSYDGNGPIGTGLTENQAITDLLDQVQERA